MHRLNSAAMKIQTRRPKADICLGGLNSHRKLNPKQIKLVLSVVFVMSSLLVSFNLAQRTIGTQAFEHGGLEDENIAQLLDRRDERETGYGDRLKADQDELAELDTVHRLLEQSKLTANSEMVVGGFGDTDGGSDENLIGSFDDENNRKLASFGSWSEETAGGAPAARVN